MDERLGKIQKSLDQYLELKRQYPRFYFRMTIYWKYWVNKKIQNKYKSILKNASWCEHAIDTTRGWQSYN